MESPSPTTAMLNGSFLRDHAGEHVTLRNQQISDDSALSKARRLGGRLPPIGSKLPQWAAAPSPAFQAGCALPIAANATIFKGRRSGQNNPPAHVQQQLLVRGNVQYEAQTKVYDSNITNQSTQLRSNQHMACQRCEPKCERRDNCQHNCEKYESKFGRKFQHYAPDASHVLPQPTSPRLCNKALRQCGLFRHGLAWSQSVSIGVLPPNPAI